MKLTVAIPTFGREGVLIHTLEQILAALDPTRMELLVVDQTPRHEEATERQLRVWQDGGRLRRVTLSPPSLPAARNRAYQEARGEIVLFLDDDVILPPHLLAKHLEAYEDPALAAVTGQVFNCLDPNRPPPLDRPREGTRPHALVDAPCSARNISGGNHSVRRHVALAIGGFDEYFVAAALAEDLDFAQRLLDAGHRILYQPEAWIIHLGVKSGGCGITGQSTWPEWTHTSGLWLYGFRHGRKLRNWGWVLRMALRNGPLRREVVMQPRRWIPAWWGFAQACAYGWRHRGKTKNPWGGP